MQGPTSAEETPRVDVRSLVHSAPPRPASAVAALTAPMLRRTTRTWRMSLAAVVCGAVAAAALPSGARGAVALLTAACLAAIGFGVIGLLIALYYNSHRVVFESLIRSRPFVVGEVVDVWRGTRGMQGIRVTFPGDDGSPLELTATGEPFADLCRKGQAVPCVYEHRKYAALLLPNDELALGVWRRSGTQSARPTPL